MKLSEQHKTSPAAGVERLEYRCTSCQQGNYHFDKHSDRIEQNSQLPHKCTHCGSLVYFSIPYPALRYKGRVFVDWETIRGINV